MLIFSLGLRELRIETLCVCVCVCEFTDLYESRTCELMYGMVGWWELYLIEYFMYLHKPINVINHHMLE